MSSKRIVIDGYNLALTRGTGIRTFTLLLQQALANLGHDTRYLYGTGAFTGDDALLREISFYDAPPPPLPPKAARRKFYRMLLQATLNRAPKGAEVPHSGSVIIPESDQVSAPVFNARDLYEVAFLRQFRSFKFLDFDFPEQADVFHATYPLPVRMRNAKQIVTMHDMIPMRLPYTTTDNKREILSRHRTAAKIADGIMTVSEHSKKDICELLGVPEEKVSVVRQPSRFKPMTSRENRDLEKVLSRYDLTPKNYILHVGAIEPKKNLKRLLQAYCELDPETPIVFTGSKAWMWEQEVGWILETENPGLKKRVKFFNHIPFRDMPFLYAGATCMAFPSIYEGWGLPVVEALSFGTPVLTSNTSSLPEVAGEAALYCDPYSVRDIRDKLERLLSDEELRTFLSGEALARSQVINMGSFTGDVAAAYSRL
jgi:glycosyltransferase involved in cell wall biosynthesis